MIEQHTRLRGIGRMPTRYARPTTTAWISATEMEPSVADRVWFTPRVTAPHTDR